MVDNCVLPFNFTSRVSILVEVIISVTSGAGTVSLKSPFSFVLVPTFVPFTLTDAPITVLAP
jgi:hypothetical protein